MVVARRADGRFAAEVCDCRHQVRVEALLERARIPKRYEHCLFESYETGSRFDPSLVAAKLMARQFVDGYPVTTDGRGLLLTGSIGVGKTHLAVGILYSLIVEKGVRGLFCDYRELLKQIQNSYNDSVKATELDVLRPVFDTEVLVLDELGAVKPTEWVWDTVSLILNTRYNAKRTTIITTNLPNLGERERHRSANIRSLEAAKYSAEKETLGDRIGERMLSRLHEMCRIIEMDGADYRRSLRSASLR